MDRFFLKAQNKESCKGSELKPLCKKELGYEREKTDIGDWSLSLVPARLLQDLTRQLKHLIHCHC